MRNPTSPLLLPLPSHSSYKTRFLNYYAEELIVIHQDDLFLFHSFKKNVFILHVIRQLLNQVLAAPPVFRNTVTKFCLHLSTFLASSHLP